MKLGINIIHVNWHCWYAVVRINRETDWRKQWGRR